MARGYGRKKNKPGSQRPWESHPPCSPTSEQLWFYMEERRRSNVPPGGCRLGCRRSTLLNKIWGLSPRGHLSPRPPAHRDCRHRPHIGPLITDTQFLFLGALIHRNKIKQRTVDAHMCTCPHIYHWLWRSCGRSSEDHRYECWEKPLGPLIPCWWWRCLGMWCGLFTLRPTHRWKPKMRRQQKSPCSPISWNWVLHKQNLKLLCLIFCVFSFLVLGWFFSPLNHL